MQIEMVNEMFDEEMLCKHVLGSTGHHFSRSGARIPHVVVNGGDFSVELLF